MDLIREQFLRELLGQDDLQLTDDQEHAMQQFLHFLDSNLERAAYLLTGSAGTGKTFLINLFTKILKRHGYKVILLAPTGRAAKVITRRTRRHAFTIHHHIYSPQENAFGQLAFTLKNNKEASKTVYIIDEASMIGNRSDGSSARGLLSDLLEYVYRQDPDRKLILVGDPVQLPPVGYADSPALDPQILQTVGIFDLYKAHLSEVKRQLVDSGILENAVLIRDAYLAADPAGLNLDVGRDVQPLENGYEGLEIYMGYHEEGNPDRVVFITYSNYQATRVNQAIRHHLWGSEEILLPSDMLMVVRNNYSWGDSKRLPFLANGEMGTVRTVYKETYEERYGLRWMDAEIEFIDNRGDAILIECKLVLDLLQDKRPQLPQEVMQMLTQAREQEYAGLSPSQARQLMRTDPYVNALQVKYGYAITGHKAQGGQWENVLIGFEPDYGQNPMAYIRWSYTVFTRAEERVFLLNCPFVPK